jgi:site-specific recombinase XerD
MVRLSLSQTVSGFTLACQARGLSKNTIDDYSRTYKKLAAFLGDDPELAAISSHQVEEFLAGQDVSKKSKLNYHIGLSALWTWAISEGIAEKHIMRQIRPPRPEVRELEPFSEAELRRLAASVSHATQHNLKLRAAILLLLDTGLRASELCSIRVRDVDLKAGYLIVMGKGDKERRAEFGARTAQAIWKYLASRGTPNQDEYLLLSFNGRKWDRDDLAHRLQALGIRAGVPRCHPHRFRHTFAILFLKNGGNALALQRLLGHSTMEMVRRYVKYSDVDLHEAHRKASPVENMRL